MFGLRAHLGGDVRRQVAGSSGHWQGGGAREGRRLLVLGPVDGGVLTYAAPVRWPFNAIC